jgi:hypothetical protein
VTRRRHFLGYVVITVLFVAFVVLYLGNYGDRIDGLERQAAQAEAETRAATDVAAQLAEQVEAMGGEPAADVEEVVPEAGDPLPGPRGIPGLPGIDGRDGRNGKDSKVPGPRGATGAPGSDGTDGKNGRDGKDSEVPGPAGPTGPPGPAGPAGKDSTAPGPQGPAGKDGQSAYPFEFTFTVERNPGQSTTYTVTCRADGCSVSSS